MYNFSTEHFLQLFAPSEHTPYSVPRHCHQEAERSSFRYKPFLLSINIKHPAVFENFTLTPKHFLISFLNSLLDRSNLQIINPFIIFIISRLVLSSWAPKHWLWKQGTHCPRLDSLYWSGAWLFIPWACLTYSHIKHTTLKELYSLLLPPILRHYGPHLWDVISWPFPMSFLVMIELILVSAIVEVLSASNHRIFPDASETSKYVNKQLSL